VPEIGQQDRENSAKTLLNSGDTEPKVNRRVSWAGADAITSAQLPLPDPDQRICFVHSDREIEADSDVAEYYNGQVEYPRTPADIGRLPSVLPTSIKSILKRTPSDLRQPLQTHEEIEFKRGENTEREEAGEPWVNPVCDTVVEKRIEPVPAPGSDPMDHLDEPVKPKLSKFKAMRSQR